MEGTRGFHVRYRHGGRGDTVPVMQGEPVVTNAALDVFNNFVDTLARVTPPTITMKEQSEISRREVRRSTRCKEAMEAHRRAQLPPPPMIAVCTTPTTTDQKV